MELTWWTCQFRIPVVVTAIDVQLAIAMPTAQVIVEGRPGQASPL
jgi:hypothetical protein